MQASKKIAKAQGRVMPHMDWAGLKFHHLLELKKWKHLSALRQVL